jgi:hypothetical protein
MTGAQFSHLYEEIAKSALKAAERVFSIARRLANQTLSFDPYEPLPHSNGGEVRSLQLL